MVAVHGLVGYGKHVWYQMSRDTSAWQCGEPVASVTGGQSERESQRVPTNSGIGIPRGKMGTISGTLLNSNSRGTR